MNQTQEEEAAELETQVFTFVYQSLKRALTFPEEDVGSRVTNPLLCVEDQMLMEFPSAYLESLPPIIQRDTTLLLTHLQLHQQQTRTKSQLKLAKYQYSQDQFTQYQLPTLLQDLHRIHAQFQHLLRTHVEQSILRVQELLFECLGEVQKAIDRTIERIEFHQARIDQMVDWSNQQFLWTRFLMILQRDCLDKTFLTDLPPTIPIDSLAPNPLESTSTDLLILNPDFDRLQAYFQSQFPPADVKRIEKIIEIRPSSTKASRRTPTPNTLEWFDSSLPVPQLINVMMGMKKSSPKVQVFDRLIDKCASPIAQFKVSPSKIYLSSNFVNWFFHSQATPKLPVDARIYYCYQEKLQPVENCFTSARTEFLTFLEQTLPQMNHQMLDLDKEFLQGQFPIYDTINICDKEQQYQYHIPEILQATCESKDGEKHQLEFLPATVADLMQTIAFHKLHLTPAQQTLLQQDHPELQFPIRPVYSNLFVVLEPDSMWDPQITLNAKLNCILHPLSEAALDELIAIYLIRTRAVATETPSALVSNSSANALSVFPPALTSTTGSSKYCLLSNPSVYKEATTPSTLMSTIQDRETKLQQHFHDRRELNPRISCPTHATTSTASLPPVSSVLIKYADAEEASEAASPLSTSTATEAIDSRSKAKKQQRQRKNQFNAALGNFCHWRACLELSTSETSPKTLCELHSQIKGFLDTLAPKGCASEAARYVPKVSSIVSDTRSNAMYGIETSILQDLQIVKQSSSLLQELLSSKLSKTIVAFCRRAASKDCIAALATTTASAKSSTKPVDMKQLRTDLSQLQVQIKLAEQIFTTEREATKEIRHLLDLGIYPTSEIALTRKEFRAFEATTPPAAADTFPSHVSLSKKEFTAAKDQANTALELAVRKCRLLRQRRVEATSSRILTNTTSLADLRPSEKLKKPRRPSSASSTSSSRSRGSNNPFPKTKGKKKKSSSDRR